jgi:predicted dehydrogenase
MTPLRWGILSTSNFAEKHFIPGLKKSPLIEVAAVASRNLPSAEAYAERNGIPTAHGTYEALLADPSIDVIYNPLPNTMHAEWTRKAAEAGKHVMCEKPMGINAAELDVLLPLASSVHIAEAFMVRFHPQWIDAREVVRSGSLGRITHVNTEFNYHNVDPANIRNTAAVGGGGMYDIGCYAVVATRWFMEAEPVRVMAMADVDPKFGTDRLMSALLDIGDGRISTFSVSTQTAGYQRIQILGTEGRLEITVPFNQPADEPGVYLMHDGSKHLNGLDTTPTESAVKDQYTAQAEAFGERIRNESPTDGPLRDAIANMRVIDAVFASAKSGRAETV